MLELSKCPDFVVNRGHYFGTAEFNQQDGLSADEKAFGKEPELSDRRQARPDRVPQDVLRRRTPHMAAGPEGLEWDYVIVGSGAGGGTLAARLAEAGRARVPARGRRRSARQRRGAAARRLRRPGVPCLRLREPGDELELPRAPLRRRGAPGARPEVHAPARGVLYPRAATLGGCTAHNAMIFMPPHDSDWDHIAELTGDASWRAARMRRYARRVEDCRHAPLWRALRHLGIDPTGHGWDGWLRTEKSIPLAALGDDELVADGARHDARLRRRPGDAAGERLALAARRRRSERAAVAARQLRGPVLHAAVHARPSPRRRARAPARGRRGAPRPAARRARRARDAGRRSTPAGAARGVDYRKGRHLYRAHAGASATRRARSARCGRGAR